MVCFTFCTKKFAECGNSCHVLSRSILDDAHQGRLIDLKLKINALTANIVARMVLNKRFTGCIDSTVETEAEAHQFKEMMEEHFLLLGVFMIGDYIPWLSPLDLGGTEKRMKALRKRLDAFLDDILEVHEVKRAKGPIPEEDQDVIDVLLNEMYQQDSNESKQLDTNNVKSTILVCQSYPFHSWFPPKPPKTQNHARQILTSLSLPRAQNLFAGGTDTSTVTIEWAMSEMLRNPTIMGKLKAELDARIGKDRRVRETDLSDLPYLQAVTKETFRLHPVGPLLIPHVSTHDCEVGGYHIPTGTRLYVNVYAIGRNPKVWDRPLEFDPERFMTGLNAGVDVKGKHFHLLPFGTGRRGCPALPLGLLIVQWTLATLVHALDLSLPQSMEPKDVDMTEAYGLTVPRAQSLYLNAKLRAADHLYWVTHPGFGVLAASLPQDRDCVSAFICSSSSSSFGVVYRLGAYIGAVPRYMQRLLGYSGCWLWSFIVTENVTLRFTYLT